MLKLTQLFLLAGFFGLSACVPGKASTPPAQNASPAPETPTPQPQPSETDDPLAPLMETAAAAATELAGATRDPRLDVQVAPESTATPSADWNLVWADEFNGPEGSAVNPANWDYDVGGDGWGNDELEYYTNLLQNARQEGGNLVIEAREEVFGKRSYTSARLVTRGKVAWQYGRFEIRAKMPAGQGIWPAIWMLPEERRYGKWPLSGEIDVMEFLGHDRMTVHGTLHWGEPHTFNGKPYTLAGSPDFSEAFHVFAVEWEPEEIRWFVDGVHYHTMRQWMTSAPGANFPAPFDQPFHLLINVAVGGRWPGNPDSTTSFPARMYVDYVRVYEK